MARVVVLVHKSGVSELPAIDVLVHKEVSKRFIRELKKHLGEPANCGAVNEFLRENPDYMHVGSVDFEHTYEFNASAIDTLLWLGRRRDVNIINIDS